MDPGELRAIQYQNQKDFIQSKKTKSNSSSRSNRPMTAAQRQRAQRQNEQFKKDHPCLQGCIDATLNCVFHTCQCIFCFPCFIQIYCRKREYEKLKAARQAALNQIVQILKKSNISPKDQCHLYDARDKIKRQLEDMSFVGRKQDPTDYSKVPQIRDILDAHRRLDIVNLSKQTELTVKK